MIDVKRENRRALAEMWGEEAADGFPLSFLQRSIVWWSKFLSCAWGAWLVLTGRAIADSIRMEFLSLEETQRPRPQFICVNIRYRLRGAWSVLAGYAVADANRGEIVEFRRRRRRRP